MLFDIAGFTTTCDMLQKEGKRGAEEISKLLQSIFQEPLSQVEKNGGYIISFVGDSFLAVFREQAAQMVMTAIFAISNHFQQTTEYSSPFGILPVKYRLLVSFGKISWRIFANELQNEYIFRGRVIQELQRLSKRKSGLVFTEEAIWKIGRSHFSKKGSKYQPVSPVKESPPERRIYPYNQETANSFLHARFRKLQPENELRQVGCCFVNMDHIKYEARPEAVSILQHLAVRHGGFVNKLIYAEGGLLAIVLFGMPLNSGDAHSKVCHFALETVQAEPSYAMGISSGALFTGFLGSDDVCEYTALGHPMNLAARLVGMAKPGEILTSGSILNEAGKIFAFAHHATSRLKGIGAAVKSYKLIKVLAGLSNNQQSKFVDRMREKAWLRTIIETSITEGKNTVAYIRGDTGVGKTRLVQEVLNGFYGRKTHILKMHCDLLLPKPLLPDRKFVKSFYGLEYEELNPTGYKKFHKRWIGWARGKQEILDIEPMIAFYLRLISREQLKKEHPEWLKPEMQLAGWLTYVRELAARKHLLLFIDDIQRIDPVTQEMLIQVAKAGIAPLCIIMNYTPVDMEERIDLELPGYASHTLDLKPLSTDDSIRLYTLLLGFKKLPPATAHTLRISTRGNPALIELFASTLLENGWVKPDGEIVFGEDAWKHFKMNDIIDQRLNDLSQDTKECVYNTCVLGNIFDLRVLSKMLGYVPHSELQQGMHNLVWIKMRGNTYAFAHFLIRSIVYQRILSEKLASLHLKAAHAMEEVYKESTAKHTKEIALHYQKAEELSK